MPHQRVMLPQKAAQKPEPLLMQVQKAVQKLVLLPMQDP